MSFSDYLTHVHAESMARTSYTQLMRDLQEKDTYLLSSLVKGVCQLALTEILLLADTFTSTLFVATNTMGEGTSYLYCNFYLGEERDFDTEAIDKEAKKALSDICGLFHAPFYSGYHALGQLGTRGQHAWSVIEHNVIDPIAHCFTN